ncbi:hypothetical protein CCZ01_03620 [Helicobacter monodelphidis]|uniref:hypothetical protein n=1 Tax=Helicobacter sp. 15-1451 TaxID=2004995 RepID=UPI000DCCE276|nr:hypothetical protein [Helicobacter sp. 15-1451]RAX58174.1 hypothetical protein CCZ01_03620 [Helicobacter sp. 15-1451]
MNLKKVCFVCFGAIATLIFAGCGEGSETLTKGKINVTPEEFAKIGNEYLLRVGGIQSLQSQGINGMEITSTPMSCDKDYKCTGATMNVSMDEVMVKVNSDVNLLSFNDKEVRANVLLEMTFSASEDMSMVSEQIAQILPVTIKYDCVNQYSKEKEIDDYLTAGATCKFDSSLIRFDSVEKTQITHPSFANQTMEQVAKNKDILNEEVIKNMGISLLDFSLKVGAKKSVAESIYQQLSPSVASIDEYKTTVNNMRSALPAFLVNIVGFEEAKKAITNLSDSVGKFVVDEVKEFSVGATLRPNATPIVFSMQSLEEVQHIQGQEALIKMQEVIDEVFQKYDVVIQ